MNKFKSFLENLFIVIGGIVSIGIILYVVIISPLKDIYITRKENIYRQEQEKIAQEECSKKTENFEDIDIYNALGVLDDYLLGIDNDKDAAINAYNDIENYIFLINDLYEYYLEEYYANE